MHRAEKTLLELKALFFTFVLITFATILITPVLRIVAKVLMIEIRIYVKEFLTHDSR